MELGATICTPQRTLCVSCPMIKNCKAFRVDQVARLPRAKPRKKMEIWLWEPFVMTKKSTVALQKNNYAPFLKNQPLFPGRTTKLSKKPSEYSLKHTITHHQIYVKLSPKNPARLSLSKDIYWVKMEELVHSNPSILLQKILKETLP